MKLLKKVVCSFIFFLAAVFLPLSANGEKNLPHPDTYVPTPFDMEKIKKMFDDPRDLIVTFHVNFGFLHFLHR